ncbi:MAG: hypothetical protein LBI96_07220, partial [Odoribacteraceae bacterium]|nr:hypothetical protein [Odoribacteraceae bacterium]
MKQLLLMNMKQLLQVAALVLPVWSCSVNIKEAGPVLTDNGRLVTLSLAMPSTPESRALASLTTMQEDKVHEVDVLIFKGEDFFYRAIGTQPDATNKFTVKLPTNEDPYHAVVLANARSILSTLGITPALEQTGTTRTNLMSSITHCLSTPLNTCTTNLATNGIPMWGYDTELDVSDGSGNPESFIHLTRMLAK